MARLQPTGDSLPSVLVTGGARRVGAAISRDLAAQGFAVAIHHHASDEEAEALAAEIRQQGGQCETFRADLCDASETTGLLGAVVTRMGPIRLLINNASIFEPDQAHEPDARLWDMHFAIHVRAPALLSAAFARQEAIDGGLVVNMIDQRVWRLNPHFFSYTLSKSALWTATQTMAQAFAPRIRVNAIAPGPTLANERQGASDFARQVDGLIGTGPDLAAFARTIRYLWDTPSVTGQMIALDGGQHLAWETPDIAGIRE
ncbi:MAG: SDR family oxidoreductase [Rhizobiaceae bacterium]